MASNFKIYSFKTSDSLQLKLTGDFDGSSAFELINTLADYSKGFSEIFINTDDLINIHSFGIEVFQKRLGAFKKQFHAINFVGRNGHAILAD